MTFKRIIIWNLDLELEDSSLIIFRSYEDLELCKIEHSFKESMKIFVILPELPHAAVDELALSIAWIFKVNPVQIFGLDNPNRILELNEYVTPLFFPYPQGLESEAYGIINSIKLRSFRVFLSHYLHFRENVYYDFLNSFFLNVKDKGFNNLLKTKPPTAGIDAAIKRARVATGVYPESIESILESYRELFTCLTEYPVDLRASYFSAYFFSLASSIHYPFGSLDVALLLVHRSIEMALLSLCWEKKLVRRTDEGFVFEYGDRRPVGLTNLLNELTHLGDLELRRDSINLIREINHRRNLSYLTHGVYSWKKEDIDKYLAQLPEILKEITGDYAWLSRVKKLDLSKLFDIGKELSTYQDITKLYEEYVP